jgi:hypothetical protein
MDKAKIIRDIIKLMDAMGKTSNNMIEMQIALNNFYQYIFDVWEDGFQKGKKSAWTKHLN